MTIWILLRAAGIGAYVILFLSVAWGLIATTGGVARRVSKQSANHFHAFLAGTGLALLAVHVSLLAFHEYMRFSVPELMIPFRSAYRPAAVGLGVLAMYGMIAVAVSSWLRTRIGVSWWRRLHLLAIPVFVVSLLHGVFAGTDSERPWMFSMYAVTGLLTLFLVLVRGLTYGFRQPRPELGSVREMKREPAPAA
jgi:predicted ferric reductase